MFPVTVVLMRIIFKHCFLEQLTHCNLLRIHGLSTTLSAAHLSVVFFFFYALTSNKHLSPSLQISEFKEQLLYATGTKPERILEFSCGKFIHIYCRSSRLIIIIR